MFFFLYLLTSPGNFFVFACSRTYSLSGPDWWTTVTSSRTRLIKERIQTKVGSFDVSIELPSILSSSSDVSESSSLVDDSSLLVDSSSC